VRGLREKWAWTPRPWTKVSADTGVGDPRQATAEKGARHVAAVAAQLGEFLAELAATDVEEMYS
jgi:creatinine amidohydrolase